MKVITVRARAKAVSHAYSVCVFLLVSMVVSSGDHFVSIIVLGRMQTKLISSSMEHVQTQ